MVRYVLEGIVDRFERVGVALFAVGDHRLSVERPRLTPVDPLVRLAGCGAEGEHDESGSGQEELYIVLDGKATFEVDGETFDAPAGTFVSVRPESRRKATGDGTVLALGATPGEAYQGIDWGEAWPFHRESMIAYGEQRYADALEAVRNALEHMPDHAGLNYNYACFATLAGETGDETFAHLRLSVELLPRFREDRAETTTSPPYATTRGSRRLFAEP